MGLPDHIRNIYYWGAGMVYLVDLMEDLEFFYGKGRWKYEPEVTTKGKTMNINDFSKKVTKLEGGKISISIAQVKEVLKIVNGLLKGGLYKLIRKI